MNQSSDPAECLLGRIIEIHRTRRPLVILTDYDGTLTPFAPHPSWAQLSAKVRRTLAQLAACPDVFVGIVSGRSIDDLKDLVNLPNLYYAGTAGLELDLLGSRMNHPQAEHAATHLDDWIAKLRGVIDCYPGTWIERKPLGMTVHYRHLNIQLLRPFQEEVCRTIEQLAGRPKHLDVCLGLEITPDLGWDKGTALESILDDAARDALPIFAGDTANDLEAMRAARRCGGLAIAVGADAPKENDFWLPSPEVFTGVLTRLAKIISPG